MLLRFSFGKAAFTVQFWNLIAINHGINCSQPASIIRLGFMTVLFFLWSEVIVKDGLMCAVVLGTAPPFTPQNLSLWVFFL